MLHIPTAQLGGVVVVLHTGIPFVVVHPGNPRGVQTPQSATLLSCVSQPFPIMPSQLPQPVAHWMEQTPLVQLGVSLFVLHGLLHAPQLLMSVPVAVSQSVPVDLQWV